MGEMADWLTEFCEWKPFDTAPKTQSDVIVWREDAGTFVARFCSPLTEDGEPLPENEWLWFTAEGEDLTDDLPTHWLVELDQIPEPKTTNSTFARIGHAANRAGIAKLAVR